MFRSEIHSCEYEDCNNVHVQATGEGLTQMATNSILPQTLLLFHIYLP
jgi:hypothetical protein